MRKLILISALLVSGFAQAENWVDFKHKTEVGAFYVATCLYCNDNGRYNNDDTGYWRCTNDNPNMSPAIYRGCKEAIFAALVGKFRGEQPCRLNGVETPKVLITGGVIQVKSSVENGPKLKPNVRSVPRMLTGTRVSDVWC